MPLQNKRCQPVNDDEQQGSSVALRRTNSDDISTTFPVFRSHAKFCVCCLEHGSMLWEATLQQQKHAGKANFDNAPNGLQEKFLQPGIND